MLGVDGLKLVVSMSLLHNVALPLQQSGPCISLRLRATTPALYAVQPILFPDPVKRCHNSNAHDTFA